MPSGADLPLNVAIGATMANQEEYDRDRMKLVAVKRDRNPLFTFASFEPLLGPIILDCNAPDQIIVGGGAVRQLRNGTAEQSAARSRLAVAQRIAAGLLAVTAICMGAARYA